MDLGLGIWDLGIAASTASPSPISQVSTIYIIILIVKIAVISGLSACDHPGTGSSRN